MRVTIPVMHCFDKNYVIPAAVSFYSMLEHASDNYDYLLYVLHSDIPEVDQQKLRDGISCFKNANLKFIDMADRFQGIFEKLSIKGHYSKEMFYKLVAPDVFEEYEKIIITDVDVVFLGDISNSYLSVDVNTPIYFGGCRGLIKSGSWAEKACKDDYLERFTSDEVEKLTTGAGFIVFNLKFMREKKLVKKFLKFLEDNSSRLRQPEQDVLNLVCYPQIHYLPANTMVCNYAYDFYENPSDFALDSNYSSFEVCGALRYPVQLHFAGSIKPWNSPDCTKAEIWYKYVFKTPFARDFLHVMQQKFNIAKAKRLFDIKIPLSRRSRLLVLKIRQD